MSNTTFTVADIPIPVKIYIENRNNATVSITQRNVIVRLPKHLSAEEKEKFTQKHLEWAKKTIQEKKMFSSLKQSIEDYNGREISIYNTTFFIKILESKTSKNKLSYLGNCQIEIHLTPNKIRKNNLALLQQLLIKFTNKFFKNKITKEAHRLNELHFKETIKEIKLKHSTSKWGACYPDKTLIFSTKLLLFPNEIIEYVIIHELAHLKEMNHSPRFWKLVENAMPNYKKQVKWLKENQNKYDF